MLRASVFALAAFAAVVPAFAQDIRGLEVCTAEKAMDRRTSCLQSNVEFLHQALDKQRRDLQSKLDAANREGAAQKAELAALKAELAKLQQEMADLKKLKSDNKTDKK
jgi:septal ring factor EnvC (AmiA/AmiB activator)